jgi:hypothetical protein
MSFNKVAVIGAILFGLLLAACGPATLPETGGSATNSPLQPTAVPTSEAQGSGFSDIAQLEEALSKSGATVERGEVFTPDFFTAKGQKLTVNGAEIQVFQFDDEAAAQTAAGTITNNGYAVGTAMVEWVDPPSFWVNGSLIVLYVGRDQGTIDRLTGVLGEPLTKPGAGGPVGSKSLTYDTLIEQLRAAGAQVEPGETLQADFLGVESRMLKVNGADVQVWEFIDEQSAQAAASTIQANGYIIGNAAVDWIDQPNFFSRGRVVVLYVGKDAAMIELLTKVVGEPITGANMWQQSGTPQPDVVQMAINELSQMTGAAVSEISVVSFEQVDWTDSCLGLGGPAESCLQATTPGWRIVLEAGGQQYEFRTDETGESIRSKELPADVIEAAIKELSQMSGAAVSDIKLVSAEEAEWTDSCLGLGGPAESCLQVITPGWKIVLEVGGTQYEVRTDETGQNVRVKGF